MGTTTFDTAQLETLTGSIRGTVLLPGDDAYEAARRVHNGLIDRRPAAIVRCRSAADVAAAVKFARATGAEISVRGGGHNVGGLAVADGALMIDLAEMKNVSVDGEARLVEAQGGVIWAELNEAAAAHGLAVTGGAISTTGIAGFTLGGGLGWLMGTYGLAADNLVAVELVTADGEILDVDADSHPDLFWALRGGGGNFGVATTFTYRLHPLATVTGGLIIHPVDVAPDLLRFYRDAVADLPDELSVFAALVHAPDGSGMKLTGFAVCHAGDPEQAQRDLEPFLTWGSPVMTEVGPMPYPVMNTLLDENFPTGSLNYWLSSFTSGLPDGLIDAMVERFASAPSPMSGILLERFHGAVTRVGVTDTAVPHREVGWNLLLPTVWLDPATTEENIRWTKDTHAAFAEHLVERRWLNYLTDDQGESAVRAAYGPNWDRLVEVKRRYDPENVFHRNQNIAP
ncbi:MAG TPA: FAD-binding oxidoreductase [Gaiella sp.]|jgi:FAD/FMN-containing dehydrogenase